MREKYFMDMLHLVNVASYIVVLASLFIAQSCNSRYDVFIALANAPLANLLLRIVQALDLKQIS